MKSEILKKLNAELRKKNILKNEYQDSNNDIKNHILHLEKRMKFKTTVKVEEYLIARR